MEKNEIVLQEIEEIRAELGSIINDMSGIIFEESPLRSESLPKGTRETIVTSLTKMMKLNKRMMELEKSLVEDEVLAGLRYNVELRWLDEAIGYWSNMIESGNFYRSHK